ncbi:MAG: response regulator [Chloroflexi bacterium]|nr:response regulator [Chloroflexota bacterium]
MEKTSLLLIEDNPADARLIKEMLAGEQAHYDLEWRQDLATGLASLGSDRIDLVLLDLNLPDSRGLDTVATILEKAPRVPVVVLTGVSDEELAIRAVRNGAQDYLVKGQVDTAQLVRSIRYAVARRAGGERHFTLKELQGYDGKEGRPAYIAFEGKVYDQTGNAHWKAGIHMKQHAAGEDLTGLLEEAPHGVETLLKAHIMGDLVREPPLARKVLISIEGHHPHSLVVHFSIAYGIGAPLLALLYLLTGQTALDNASYYLVLLGVAGAPLCALSGLLSWKLTYEGKTNPLFSWKMILTAALLAITVASTLWRWMDERVLVERNYVYLALLVSMAPLAAISGYLGGKVSHP